MTLSKPENGTLAVIWRYAALTLLSVTLALAAFFGTEMNTRVTALEADKVAQAALLAKMNTKLDILIDAHNLRAIDKK